MKVSELEGKQLDYWAAKAGQQKRVEFAAKDGLPGVMTDTELFYSPSTNWMQGGPIIEREHIMLVPPSNDFVDQQWGASSNDELVSVTGETPLIAAMRCFVICKFGYEVDDRQTHHV